MRQPPPPAGASELSLFAFEVLLGQLGPDHCNFSVRLKQVTHLESCWNGDG